MFDKLNGSGLDRRSFLRGSAMFAAAIGVSVIPAFAQEPQQKPEEEKKKEEPKKEEPKNPFAEGDKDEKKLVDAEGREYRVRPQCAYNMYKQGRMWVCENCGYSYVE